MVYGRACPLFGGGRLKRQAASAPEHRLGVVGDWATRSAIEGRLEAQGSDSGLRPSPTENGGGD